MNLVETIKGQLSGEATRKLASALGADQQQARDTIDVGVPGLLAALAGTAREGGAGKIASALNQFDLGSLEKWTGTLTGDSSDAARQGGSMLDSILSPGTLDSLASMLSRFTGLDAALVKKALAYLAPLVLGTLAKQFARGSVTADGLQNLFAEQKSNIARALPDGLSLAGIPGASDLRGAMEKTAGTVRQSTDAVQASGTNYMKTLVPLAVVALIGFLAWQYFRDARNPNRGDQLADSMPEHTVQRPATDGLELDPGAARLSNSLADVSRTAAQTLNGVTDAASAEAAIPKLEQLNTRLDELATLHEQLPETARPTIAKIAQEQSGSLQQLIDKVLAIPGVKEKLEPVLSELVSKLKSMEG